MSSSQPMSYMQKRTQWPQNLVFLLAAFLAGSEPFREQLILHNSYKSGKGRARKLKKKILGTPAGCSWHTRRDKQGSTGRCPRDLHLFTFEKLTEKAAGCPRDAQLSRGFSKKLSGTFRYSYRFLRLGFMKLRLQVSSVSEPIL